MFDEKMLKKLRNRNPNNFQIKGPKVKQNRIVRVEMDRFDLEAEREGLARRRMNQLKPDCPLGKKISRMNKSEDRGRGIIAAKIVRNFSKDHRKVCDNLSVGTQTDYTDNIGS